jgi:phosphate-selective porin
MSGGWYVAGAWLVTGETKTDWVEPFRPVFRGGLGAVELAARVERSRRWAHGDEAPSTHPRAGVLVDSGVGVWTLGVNWYLNRWIKVQANAVRERSGESATSFGGNARWMPVFRVQFVL